MSPIIQPTKESVNSEAAAILNKKLPKTQQKLAAQLNEIYRRLNVVFMGTPDFSVPILEALIKSDFAPKAVITAPDKPAGRGEKITPPPIKLAAQKYGIPFFQPQNKQELLIQTMNLKPDLIVVAAYGKILPKEVLDLPKYGAINVHPSLLPKYRGAAPIQFAILNNDSKTGISIMLMNEKMDEGPILSQEIIKIDALETSETLEGKLSKISAKILIKTLGQWIMLKEMPKSAQRLIYPQEQDHSKATYTKILTKEDGKIIWDKTAKEIDCQIRAFTPWPGSFTVFKAPSNSRKSQTLKILSAAVSETQTQRQLGEVFLTDQKDLAVQTGQGSLIIKELQLEGGKPMSTSEFLNGHQEIIGTMLQ